MYGEQLTPVDETVSPKTSVEFMKPRVRFEDEVVSNTHVEGVVVRPPAVYGGKGGSPLKEGSDSERTQWKEDFSIRWKTCGGWIC